MDIVGEQGGKSLLFLVLLVFIPRQDGKISINPFQLPRINIGVLFASFETAAISKTSQKISKVNMDLMQLNSKIALNERCIKTSAVVGHDDPVFLNVFLKVVEILSLDIGEHRFTIINRYRRYFVAPGIKARCLDVQIGGGFSELRKDSPMLI